MNTAIVIPARYSSSRLPGKPLLRETGKFLIQHVCEQAQRSEQAGAVIVATDDSRIEAAVRSFGGDVRMTRRDHVSGTDRVAEIAVHLDADIIVNLQGDEPLIDPAALDLLPDLLNRERDVMMATLATPIRSSAQWQDPNCVKVVCDVGGRALYFSRNPIPNVRDGAPNFDAHPPFALQHLGLYAYRRRFLLALANTPPTQLEQLEKLEQLRVLAHGHRILVGIVQQHSVGVDTMDDYRAFVRQYRLTQDRRAA